jgi:hypothetical protein
MPRLGFLLRVVHALHLDFFAGLAIGPQRLAKPSLIRRDQARGRAQDRGRRTVIALQADHLRAGEIALEAQDVFDLRAAPAIDRLVVVAHHADITAPTIANRARQQLQPQILDNIRVLIFVHQDVAEALAVIGQDVGMPAQQRQRIQEQVAEIRRIQRLQPRLIIGVKLAPLAEGIAVRVAFRHVLRPLAPVLPVVDHRRQRARRPAFLVDVFGFHQLLHQAKLVVGIQDREIRFEPGQFRVAAQHPRADGVEGAQPLHPLHHAADQRADAVLHLARGLIGEGDGQDLPRPGAPCGENVRQPRGQHARLAGARARQHQHRAFGRLHRLALFLVQPGEIRGLARNRRHFRFIAERLIQRIVIRIGRHDSLT